MNNTRDIPLALIDEPLHAHRVSIDQDALDALADSISLHGLINPINVIADGDRYEIIAGHRRYLAHKQMGKQSITATVMQAGTASDNDAIKFAENFHRADLTPMEEARAVGALFDRPEMTEHSAATLTRRSVGWINSRLALLAIHPDLQEHVHNKTLPIACAMVLSKVEDNEHRLYLSNYTIKGGASVFTVTNWVDTWLAELANNPAAVPPKMEILQEGQRATIFLPCFACDTPTDHTKMRVIRMCQCCIDQFNGIPK